MGSIKITVHERQSGVAAADAGRSAPAMNSVPPGPALSGAYGVATQCSPGLASGYSQGPEGSTGHELAKAVAGSSLSPLSGD
jgi:hypothetical protein